MTNTDRVIIDTIDTADYMTGDLSDNEIEVPAHMIPPNPDEADVLPSQVHPSYPYGNPTSLKHPASRARWYHDPTSRALFEDMAFGGGGVHTNSALRWADLGLDDLLPVDEAKEAADRAVQARKMASGVTSNNPQTQQPADAQGQWDEEEEEEEEDGDDDDDDGNDTDNHEEEEEEPESDDVEEGEEEYDEEEEEE